jgi:hypothetical protein
MLLVLAIALGQSTAPTQEDLRGLEPEAIYVPGTAEDSTQARIAALERLTKDQERRIDELSALVAELAKNPFAKFPISSPERWRYNETTTQGASAKPGK